MGANSGSTLAATGSGAAAGSAFGPWGAVIGGGIGLAGSLLGSNAQQKAGQSGIDLQRQMYNESQTHQWPWIQAGQQAVGQLSGLTGPNGEFSKGFTNDDFQKDPGYQFRMDEGLKAIQRSAAARGGLLGGGTMKDLTQYGQGFASNEFQNAYNRFNNDRSQRFNELASIAGLGQTSAGQVGQLGANAAAGINQNMLGIGNAQAAGYAGAANAINGGFQNYQNQWNQAQYLNNMQNGGGWGNQWNSGSSGQDTPWGGLH